MPCPYFSSSDGDNACASNVASSGTPHLPTEGSSASVPRSSDGDNACASNVASSGNPNLPTEGSSASVPRSSDGDNACASNVANSGTPNLPTEGSSASVPSASAPNQDSSPADVPLHYRNYLHLDTLLGLQNRLTGEGAKAAHDEHLFIVVHQVFELWFKQVLFELDSVRAGLLCRDQLSICCRRLARVVLLLKHVLSQFEILETMTALDFREFRDHLFPASGFQSHQFRFIENMLGVRPDDRVPYNKDNYRQVFKGHDDVLKAFDRTEKEEDSLFDVTARWLEQIFHDGDEGEEFWCDYCGAVDILVASKQTEDDKSRTRNTYDSVTVASLYQECLDRGDRRLSHSALQGALLVFMRRDHPSHSEQFTVLTLLQDIDALMAQWRFLHMTTVQRMIGTSTAGTSGSVGYYYLRSTLENRYKVFLDISNLSCFLLPRSLLEEARSAQDPVEEHRQDPQQAVDRQQAGDCQQAVDRQQDQDRQQAEDHQRAVDRQQAGDCQQAVDHQQGVDRQQAVDHQQAVDRQQAQDRQ